jgi:6-phosphogluconolactonase
LVPRAPLAAVARFLVFGVASLVGLACSPQVHTLERQPIQNRGMKARARAQRVVIYASEREQLHTYALDSLTGELSLTSSVSLPEPVHYATADATSRFLYVSASDGSTQHGLYAFGIDPETGSLAEHGQPLVPPLGRVIHLSVDPAGRHLVLAHNRAAQLSSVRLNADGSLAGFVEQAAPALTGFFTHQGLLDGAGTGLVACGLGADASDGAAEQPGSLTVFRYLEGQLTRQQTVLPGPGLGPRHLDYRGDHVFVAMERGNRLFSYRYQRGWLDERPAFDVPTLRDPANVRPRQRAGAIHIHPDGKHLYLSNRADRSSTLQVSGQPVEVFVGGENNIALFALEPESGEPRLVEHYDTRGFEPRTFTIEPSGRFLFVGNQSRRNVLDAAGALSAVPPGLVVFEIGEGGRLKYLLEYDFARGDVFWVGAVQLPG